MRPDPPDVFFISITDVTDQSVTVSWLDPIRIGRPLIAPFFQVQVGAAPLGGFSTVAGTVTRTTDATSGRHGGTIAVTGLSSLAIYNFVVLCHVFC